MNISIAFQTEMKKAQTLLGAYKLEEARALLQSLKSENAHQERMRQHYFARAEMRQGRLAEALSILDQAILDFPPYIGLRADRLSCLYHLGPKTAWREALTEFAAELDQCRTKLSIGSLYRAELLLAKFLEEDAEISKALQIYEGLKELLEREKLSRDAIFMTAQILRVRALFTDNTDTLKPLYRDLLTLETNENELYQDVEVQHSLMLTELALFGPLKAWNRVQAIIPHAPAQDIQLFAFDFLEFCLRRKLEIAPSLLELAASLSDLADYEQALLKIAQNQLNQQIHQWPRTMSLSSYLKCLHLLSQRTLAQEHTSELEFLITSLSTQTRGYWRRYFGSKTTAATFHLEQATQSLVFEGRTYNLKSKPASFKLLSELEKAGHASLEHLTESLWQTQYDQTYYNRLRVLVQRTDALLKEITGRSKSLRFSADGISISHRARGNTDT